MPHSAFIISDIHLGATTSLLTAYDDAESASHKVARPLANQVLTLMLDALRERMTPGEQIEQCILLGDIFDFSFASYGLAMRNGAWFFEQLVQSGLFKEFVYVPGNHDHHLWQQITEYNYQLKMMPDVPVDYPKTLPPNMVLTNTFLDDLMPEGSGISVTYPNYTLMTNGERFYFHHGHYLQKLYVVASNFLSELLETRDINDLELLNAPFLEFGWYNVCQAYNLGDHKLIDRLYFMIKNEHSDGLDRLLRAFLQKLNRWDTSIMPTGHQRLGLLPRLLNRGLQSIGPFLLKQLFFKHSKLFSTRHYASSARYKTIEGELEQAALHYLKQYILHTAPERHVHFVFGHTHAPSQGVLCQDGSGEMSAKLYNTGGWIVDRLDEKGSFIVPDMMPLLITEAAEVVPLPLNEWHHQQLFDWIYECPSLVAVRSQMEA